jgi:hypothetical protein
VKPHCNDRTQEAQDSQDSQDTRGCVGEFDGNYPESPTSPMSLMPLASLMPLTALMYGHVRECVVSDDGKESPSRKLFDLARRLLSVKPPLTQQQKEEAIRVWTRLSIPFADEDVSANLISLEAAMKKVKTPFDSILGACAERAKQIPDSWVAPLGNGQRIGLLMKLAIALQERAGEGNSWFLTTRDAARHIGMKSSEQANHLLHRLVDMRRLELVSVGGRPKGGKARGSEFKLTPNAIQNQTDDECPF